jgi:hypothetical protein
MAPPSDYARPMVDDDGDERVWTPNEILRRYQDGERDFRGLDIGRDSQGQVVSDSDGRSFRGAVLDDADFTDCFIFADFTGASLRNCKFRANVKTCSFDLADLRGADFTDAAIDSACRRRTSAQPRTRRRRKPSASIRCWS